MGITESLKWQLRAQSRELAIMGMRRRSRRRLGCGLLVVAVAVTCVLLVVNRLIVSSFYSAVVPGEWDFPKIRTVVCFVVLVCLLVPEWWLIDWVMEGVRRVVRSLDRARRAGGR